MVETQNKNETEQKLNIEDVLVSYEITLIEQGREIQELKRRFAMLEYAMRQHVNNVETAHKL